MFAQGRKIIAHQNDEPIRAELYSVERLEQFAAALAAEQTQTAQPKKFRQLLPRLEENGRVLVASYRNLSDAIRRERVISPAAEWLVDNFHIVEDQVREIREDLPRGFYGELPKLMSGEFAGYPRIYSIAFALIAHTDSRLDVETLRRFLVAYQKTTPLKIGELWAMAITLRIVLVENLRRLAERIVISRKEGKILQSGEKSHREFSKSLYLLRLAGFLTSHFLPISNSEFWEGQIRRNLWFFLPRNRIRRES